MPDKQVQVGDFVGRTSDSNSAAISCTFGPLIQIVLVISSFCHNSHWCWPFTRRHVDIQNAYQQAILRQFQYPPCEQHHGSSGKSDQMHILAAAFS